MNWIQNLYETYENCQSAVGKDSVNPLLPVCHMIQKVHIEVTLDSNGNFVKAEPIYDENSNKTIIPCTEKSSSRTNSPEPHPLCDKLQYVAKKYKEYGGEKKPYFEFYICQLKSWCDSKFAHSKAVAVYKYVEEGDIIGDLVKSGIFILKNGKLLKNWDGKKENKPKIFSIYNNQEWQAESFIRWIVITPGELQSETWKDKSLWQSWIEYYQNFRDKKGFCSLKGEKTIISELHPKYIRKSGDGAKLISSNDTEGYTFRGRFFDADQACSLSLDVSQKAHLGLQWLIRRQGKVFYVKDSNGKSSPALTVVAWSVKGSETPDPFADPLGVLGEEELPVVKTDMVYTAQNLAMKLKNKIAGYNQKLENTDRIVVMGLNSATPGRLAITFYRELTGSDFLNRLNTWHEKCAWFHNYATRETEDKKTGKKKKIYYWFTGAPAPDDIAQAAYGKRIDDKLRNSVVERLLPCIIDGQQVPFDLVASLRNRACNRIGMEDWEWRKVLSICCALYRKYYEKEGFDMALEENRTTRDYLYGRLLALADSLEQWALNKGGEGRQTTVARLMQRFADHPFSTWRTIELALAPYKARLGGRSLKRQRLIDEVKNKFESVDNYTCDKPLSGEFLLAYSCQKEKLRQEVLLYKQQLEEKKAKGLMTQEEIEIAEEEIESI